jgi:hypothetical protein
LNNQFTQLKAGGYYSVFNPTTVQVALKIPGIPTGLSRLGIGKAASQPQGQWSVKVLTYKDNGVCLGTSYCGFNKGAGDVTYQSLPPSFESIRSGVFNPSTKAITGNAITHVIHDGGCSYMLAIENKTNVKERVHYKLETVGSIPQNTKVLLYNASTGLFEDINTNIDVGSGETVFRWLFVGTAAYLAKAGIIAPVYKLALLGVSPNPFKNMVRVRYSIPYEGIKNMSFAVYTLSGKRVWTEVVNNRYGINELVWNGQNVDGKKIGAGVYILRMVAANMTLKTAGVFEKKLTFIP